MFQFQYGTIKGESEAMKEKIRFRFQFQYGTIKGDPGIKKYFGVFCFNSNMVRLKEILNDTPKGILDVSIPIWYD